MTKKEKPFAKEADLCSTFIAAATHDGEWTAYPETAGFDILMVRKSDGAQIGVEAKLALNAKVLDQALPSYLQSFGADRSAPDYRAVLVPKHASGGLVKVCEALGIMVIRQSGWDEYRMGREYPRFDPELPTGSQYENEGWHDWCPTTRIMVPDYVPDVEAGHPSPLALTDWKIRAIKMAILATLRPVTRADFKALRLSPTIWTNPKGWLVSEGRGKGYVPSPRMPDFKKQHPVNYDQIAADIEKWEPARKIGDLI